MPLRLASDHVPWSRRGHPMDSRPRAAMAPQGEQRWPGAVLVPAVLVAKGFAAGVGVDGQTQPITASSIPTGSRFAKTPAPVGANYTNGHSLVRHLHHPTVFQNHLDRNRDSGGQCL